MLVAVVLNPTAGAGAAGRRLRDLEDALAGVEGLTHLVHRTAGPGDATRLVRQSLEGGADGVLAIGGDGTFNEAINGFFDGSDPVRPQAFFLPVPVGTGGDFRRTLGISAEPVEVARALRRGRELAVDVGHLRCQGRDGGTVERCFLNIASFGLGGRVDEVVNRIPKRLGGRTAFFLASVWAGLGYRAPRVRLRLDEGEPYEATLSNVAIANGRYFGGGMHVAPMAKIDSGRFEVVTFASAGPVRLLRMSPALYAGSHLDWPEVGHAEAKVVEAEAVDDDEVLIDLDGELPGRLPARFVVWPRALRLRY